MFLLIHCHLYVMLHNKKEMLHFTDIMRISLNMMFEPIKESNPFVSKEIGFHCNVQATTIHIAGHKELRVESFTTAIVTYPGLPCPSMLIVAVFLYMHLIQNRKEEVYESIQNPNRSKACRRSAEYHFQRENGDGLE